MLRTGAQYLDSLRDGRQIWINGERVADVTTHPAFRPIVSLRARLYDMAHEAQHAAAMSYVDAASGELRLLAPERTHVTVSAAATRDLSAAPCARCPTRTRP